MEKKLKQWYSLWPTMSRVCSRATLTPLLINAELSSYNREPVATGPSNVVLISRSIYEPCYLVRLSAPGNRKLVLPRQSFRRVEGYWLPALDSRQAYVIQTFFVPLSDVSCPYSGIWEKCPLVCPFSGVFFSRDLNHLLVLPSSRRSWLCAMLDRLPWLTTTSTSGILINKIDETCSFLFFPNSLLDPIFATIHFTAYT